LYGQGRLAISARTIEISEHYMYFRVFVEVTSLVGHLVDNGIFRWAICHKDLPDRGNPRT
jgi:hypothetical protein